MLEIPADVDIRPVTVDLGGGFVEEGKGTLKLAVSAGGFTAPSNAGHLRDERARWCGRATTETSTIPAKPLPGTVQTLLACRTKLAMTTQPSSATAVQGTTARFTVAAQSAVGYQWQVNDGSRLEGRGGRLRHGTKPPTPPPKPRWTWDGWKYRCVVTGSYEVVNSSEATLTVKPAQVEIAVSPQGDVRSEGGGGTFTYGNSVTVTGHGQRGKRAHFRGLAGKRTDRQQRRQLHLHRDRGAHAGGRVCGAHRRVAVGRGEPLQNLPGLRRGVRARRACGRLRGRLPVQKGCAKPASWNTAVSAPTA